jgi:hypothetical protein
MKTVEELVKEIPESTYDCAAYEQRRGALAGMIEALRWVLPHVNAFARDDVSEKLKELEAQQ